VDPPVNATARTRRRFLRPAALTAVIFFSVSGGPYGLEPLINLVGGKNALLLILITPLLWAVPVILMVLELNGMMPRNGGYYQWVKTGLGPMLGFFEGWWTWLYMFVDLAIYPVLFVEYTSFFFPEVAGIHYGVCLAIVWICAGLNLLGILPVGRSSVAFGSAVMFPFVVLFIAAFRNGFPVHPGGGMAAQGSPVISAVGMGLFVVMWNYLGWDNSSTFAEEVDRPVRSYLVSIAWAFGLILSTYALSIVAATQTGLDPATLEREGFPALGFQIGGTSMAGLLAAGGMASALGLFVANLLSVSRLPKAMSDDGCLPPVLRKVDRRRGTPYVSIIACATIVSGMVLWHFEDLLIIDVVLYGCALFLEFLALISLRRRHPGMDRPFRIPLSPGGLVAMTCLPALCFLAGIAALAANESIHTYALVFALASLCTAPLAWLAVRKRETGGTPEC
jgi:amino acid transporter